MSVEDERSRGGWGWVGVGGGNGEGNNVFIMSLMCRRTLLFSISEHQPPLTADSAGEGVRWGVGWRGRGGGGVSRTQITCKTDMNIADRRY